jgi:hypothetical protein
LVNGYGPTEATTFACCQPLSPPETGGESVPIGRPLPNTVARVLDSRLRPVPTGAVGELCLGGQALARGYLGRPARTARAFVPDPLGTSGERLYRTGDLVRRRGSGALEFLGRRDRQLKVRGFRVEPGEIEARLEEHGGVARAVVLPRGHGLVAHYVPHNGPPPEEATLRAHLAERLPAFLLPERLFPWDHLPLGPNGKVDRGALEARSTAGSESGEDPGTVPAAGRNALERHLLALFRELLEEPALTLDQNLFEAGVHSLLVLRAQARLEEHLGRAVPITHFFSHPSIAALAGHLAEDEDGSPQGPPEDKPEAVQRAARRKNALRRRRGRRGNDRSTEPTP